MSPETRAQSARPSARQTAADEAAVRDYLREMLVDYRAGEGDQETEHRFVAVGGRWAGRAGVGRHALAVLGIDDRVLDRAGVRHLTIVERLRGYWQPTPFSLGDLARRSGIPAATVRRAIIADERAGLLRRVDGGARAILWETT